MLLPEPDSPTSPKVSPSCTENETPSTALTVIGSRFSRPLVADHEVLLQIGHRQDVRCRKVHCSCPPSRIEVTGHVVTVRHGVERRFRGAADIHHVRAAGWKRQPGGGVW